MNILLASDIFPPESGGPATYVVGLANALQKQGHTVQIITLNAHPKKDAVSCPLFFVQAKSKLVRYFEYGYLLWKQSVGVDAIYAMGPVNSGFPAFLVSKLRRKKLFVKVVGDYAWEQGMQRFGVNDLIDVFQNKKYDFSVECLRWIQSFVTRHAHGVIVPSEYLKRIVHGWGVKQNKIYRIYNSVHFKAVDPIVKKNNEMWIVSVGRLVPWKGFPMLMDAVWELQKEFASLRLKIIGSGPEQKNLKLRINDKKLESFVELVGEVSHEKTLAYIQGADIFVLNSGYEGLSHVMLEALSLGRPVMASRVGGNPELLEPFNMGKLFGYNNKDEIKNIIRSSLASGEWNHSGASSDQRKEFFEQFSFDFMIEQTKKVLCS